MPTRRQRPREGDVTRAFTELLGYAPWALLLDARPPKGQRGTPQREVAEGARLALLERAAAWLEERPAGVVLWRRNSSALRGVTGRPVVSGLPGEPDFDGVMKPGGVRLGVELKRPGGRQSPEQRAIESIWRAAGAVYVLVDEPHEGLRSIGRALRKLGPPHFPP